LGRKASFEAFSCDRQHCFGNDDRPVGQRNRLFGVVFALAGKYEPRDAVYRLDGWGKAASAD